jgi:putative membrane protein
MQAALQGKDHFMLAVWQPENLATSLLSALCFGVLGIVLMLVGFKLFDLILPKVDFEKELAENHNIAVAIVVAAFLLGIALILAMVIAY